MTTHRSKKKVGFEFGVSLVRFPKPGPFLPQPLPRHLTPLRLLSPLPDRPGRQTTWETTAWFTTNTHFDARVTRVTIPESGHTYATTA